jgi:uncharacterized protein (TIGR02996 family)
VSDEKALLAAIWEHPHEDTPRLVYADWLQEHDQPERAEFIRIQCELARLGEWADSPRKPELEKREKQLWAKHAKVWKAGLSPLLQKLGGFVRGFPSPPPRAMTSVKFLKLAATDFAGAPLWNYHLSANRKFLPQVLACPQLLRVGALDFRFWFESAEDVRRFVASPNVRNIADLNISVSRFGEDGPVALAAGASALPHLRRLNLESSDLRAGAVEALVASPLADGLRELFLFQNGIGSDGVVALARAPRLARLERLDLTNCEWVDETEQPITREAVVALCASPHLKALRDLALDPVNLGDEGVRLMCATRPVFRLAVLRVFSIRTRIGDAGAEALAAWPALEDVRVLHLYGNQIGAAGAQALARSPYLNKVTKLRLDLNPLRTDRAAVKALRDRFGDAVQTD